MSDSVSVVYALEKHHHKTTPTTKQVLVVYPHTKLRSTYFKNNYKNVTLTLALILNTCSNSHIGNNAHNKL